MLAITIEKSCRFGEQETGVDGLDEIPVREDFKLLQSLCEVAFRTCVNPLTLIDNFPFNLTHNGKCQQQCD